MDSHIQDLCNYLSREIPREQNLTHPCLNLIKPPRPLGRFMGILPTARVSLVSIYHAVYIKLLKEGMISNTGREFTPSAAVAGLIGAVAGKMYPLSDLPGLVDAVCSKSRQ